MRHQNYIDDRRKAAAHHSSYVESVLTHQFVAHLSSALWLRSAKDKLVVFSSDVDDAGFDLVLKLNGCIRYVQLKQSHDQKVPSKCSIRLSFAEMEDACVVLMLYSLDNLQITSTRFLYMNRHECLRTIKACKPSVSPGRRDQLGAKKIRENYRDVPASMFEKSLDWDYLLLSLFPMFSLQRSEATQQRGPHAHANNSD